MFGNSRKEIERLKQVIKNQNTDNRSATKESERLAKERDALQRLASSRLELLSSLQEQVTQEEELRRYIDKQTTRHQRIVSKAIQLGRPLRPDEEYDIDQPSMISCMSGILEYPPLGPTFPMDSLYSYPGKSAAHSEVEMPAIKKRYSCPSG